MNRDERREELLSRFNSSNDFPFPVHTPIPAYIVGDKAYPCLPFVIPPFKRHKVAGDIAPDVYAGRERFSSRLSGLRVRSEHVFGALKRQWRSVLNPLMFEFRVKVMSLVVVFHNIFNMFPEGFFAPDPLRWTRPPWVLDLIEHVKRNDDEYSRFSRIGPDGWFPLPCGILGPPRAVDGVYHMLEVSRAAAILMFEGTIAFQAEQRLDRLASAIPREISLPPGPPSLGKSQRRFQLDESWQHLRKQRRVEESTNSLEGVHDSPSSAPDLGRAGGGGVPAGGDGSGSSAAGGGGVSAASAGQSCLSTPQHNGERESDTTVDEISNEIQLRSSYHMMYSNVPFTTLQHRLKTLSHADVLDERTFQTARKSANIIRDLLVTYCCMRTPEDITRKQTWTGFFCSTISESEHDAWIT